MKKFLIGSLAALSLLVAGSASAATISDARFSNNQTSIDANGNATVSGTFTLTVGAGEVVEWFRLLPAGNPFTDQSVGGTLGYQEGVYTNVPFSVKVPPNTGTYNVDVQGAGIFGGNRAISGADGVTVGPTSVGSVRVVASGTSSSDPVVGGGDDFWTKLAALIAGILKANQPPAPTKPAYCPSLATYAGVSYGMSGPQVSALQNLLISNGFSIPAGATGNYYNQTLSAHTAAKVACQ